MNLNINLDYDIENFNKHSLSNNLIQKINNAEINNAEINNAEINYVKKINNLEKPNINQKNNEKKNNEKDENYIEVNNTDQLFWIFFIMIKGYFEYEINNSFEKEKNLKIKFIEEFRLKKKIIKEKKFKLNSIENELLNLNKISICTFLSLCYLYNINIIFIDNNKYVELINDEDSEINLLKIENKKYKLYKNYDKIKIKDYQNNFYKIENIEKPIKSMTAYTKEELINISKKLNIKLDEKLSKKDIFSIIIEKINI